MNPYIGITGFASRDQIQRMVAFLNDHQLSDSSRKLHAGVMMSYRTLCGLPTKWSNIFPLKESIRAIFGDDGAYNCLHYADYENKTQSRDLYRALFFGGKHLHALQLDMVWPDLEIITGLIDPSRPIEIILQVGKDALDKLQRNVARVVDMIGNYDGIIHRVLLDESMGHGRIMDAKALLNFARPIREAFPKLGLVVAGGLGPETMHLVKPLVKEFPDISFDAQSQLRTKGDSMDPINWKRAEDYIVEALQIFD